MTSALLPPIQGDPAHRVRARLREPDPVPRPAPGTEARDVGRVLRLLREHSPMDSRIRRDQSHAERTATPVRTAAEPALAAGSTLGGVNRPPAGMQSHRRGAAETTLATDCQTFTVGRTLNIPRNLRAVHSRRPLLGRTLWWSRLFD